MTGMYENGGAAVRLTDAQRNLAERAQEYAADRAEKLTGWLGASTREHIFERVNDALERGATASELAREIENDFSFSPERADVIARTELSAARMAGGVESMAEAGVKTKEWLIDASGHDKDDVCDDNADDGPIGIEEPFSSGDFAPPAHPNCNCGIAGDVEE